MAKILVLEDDHAFAKMLLDWLKSERHTTNWADNGQDGLALLNTSAFDLIILDWQLPGMSGIDLCKSFRNSRKNTPILMLTGMTSVNNKTEGLDSGADDYLTKPFQCAELGARIRALLRRTGRQNQRLTAGNLLVDLDSHSAFVNETALKLLPSEFTLLAFLLKNQKEPPFSAEVILKVVWEDEDTASPDAVRTCISQLRKKLRAAGADADVQTVHGIGYRLKMSQNP